MKDEMAESTTLDLENRDPTDMHGESLKVGLDDQV